MAKNYFGITDTGKKRSNNEDAFIAGKLRAPFITACVIDGLGGYEGGEIAAALAKDAIIKTLSAPANNVKEQLVQALVNAHNHIQQEKKKVSGAGNQQMACVATLALVDTTGNKFYYAHVGDTRLYLLRDRSLIKITSDQSFVGFLEDNGRISEEEAMTHPKRNEINKALGFDSAVDTDDYFETGDSPFLPGDMLLLCSDGLSDMINNSQMAAILNSNRTIEQKAKALVDAANDAGGSDNITAVLVEHDKKKNKPAYATAQDERKINELSHEPVLSKQTNDSLEITYHKKNSSTLPAILSAALVIAVAAIAWLLYKNKTGTTQAAVQPTPLFIKKRNVAEQALADSLQSSQQHEISVVQKNNDAPVVISDTIFIDRDSLVLHGNGLVFKADSAYNGPVFVLGSKCRYALFDSVQFHNFPTAIISKGNNLHIQQVRFINCKWPVLQQPAFNDSVAVTGSFINNQFKQDSIHHNTR